MTKQLVDERTKSLVLWTVKGGLALLLMGFGVLWATTDKTLFWARFGIASYRRVDILESKLDSLIVLATSTEQKVTSLTNGRITDLYDTGVERSTNFTYEEKLTIYRAVFETHTMGLDSLRVLIRVRNHP